MIAYSPPRVADRIAAWRDRAFLPAGRLPLARGHMLRVLAGIQQGGWGRYRLEDGFMAALARLLGRSTLQ